MSIVLAPRGLLWSLFIAGGAVALAYLSRGFPNLFLEDDAYFYLGIAWNIGTGHGSTFDGLNVTNGYHLLWMVVLALVAWVTATLGFGKIAFVGATGAVSLAIAILAAVTTFRGGAERTFVILLFLFCGITMESTVLGALLLLLGRVFLGERRPGFAASMALSALVPLARIDYAWMTPALAMVQARHHRVRTLRLLPVLTGTIVGVSAHLAVERVIFGTWSSVSSAYKADLFAARGLGLLQSNLTQSGNQLRYAILAAVMMLAVMWWRRKGRQGLYAVAVAAVPVALYTVVNHMRDWYFLPALLLGALLASRGSAEHPRPWRIATAAGSVVLVTAFCGYLGLNAGDWSRSAAFIRSANVHLEDDSVMYQVDGSGFTGWWLRGHVVNGDGLVNSWTYRDRLKRGDLGGYLVDIGASHVITNRGRMATPILSWRGLTVQESDAQLVTDTGPTRNPLVRFRLFLLNDRDPPLPGASSGGP